VLFAVGCPLCTPLYAEETVLGEVAVTAARASASEIRRHASAGKLVYDREELETMDAASIGDLLRKLPGTGVFADPDSRRGRGKGRDRHMPQILVDGQPLPGGDKSPGAALRLPVDLIERIEIIRNSTAEFPVGGPGGVINLILRDVPPRSTRGARVALGATDGAPIARLEGQYGQREDDFGYLFGGSLQSQPLRGAQTTESQHFTGGGRDAWSRERIDETGRDNNLALTPRFNWNLGGGQQFTLSPFVNLTENERNTRVDRSIYSDPLAGSGLAYAGHDRELEDGRRGSGRLNAEWKGLQPGGGEWLARLTVQGEFEEKTKSIAKYDAAGSATGSTDETTHRYEREAGLMLKGKQLFLGSHFVTGAIEWRGKSSDDTQEKRSNGVPQAGGAGSSAAIDETRQVLWVQDEWQLAETHLLTPGLRWQAQESSVTDGLGKTISHAYRSLDPSLHYLWQLAPDWNLRGSIALNGKPPNTRDLSPVVRTAAGTNTSANPDKAGNAGLEAERNLSLEIGAEYFLPDRAGTLGLSVFHRRIQDQVQKLVAFESGRWVERPYNVGNAELQGALFDFKWRTDALGVPELTLRGNLSWTETRLSDVVPGLGAGEGPRQSANLGFDYDLAAWPLTVGGNFNFIGALDRESSATLRQTQGMRRQLDLYALYRLDRQFNLRFSAQNLTRQTRTNDLQEYDTNGELSRLETDRERGFASFFLALEGKW
jgi:outer membrane receptor for ferrienterochelin and colicins